MRSKVIEDIVSSLLKSHNPSKQDVNKIKVRIARIEKLSKIPSNSEIISSLNPYERKRLIGILRRKPTRTASGVMVVAAMSKPWSCPKEKPCVYCPGGPLQGVPQSYTGHEPAAMRGIQHNFDPYEQVHHRIKQYEAIGHQTGKLELIIMGGTFTSTSSEYQRWFVKGCLDAITKSPSTSLEEAKLNAEYSRIRNVGITVETRPDWAKQKHIDHMLSLGITRVEIGVQNIYDDIYKITNREHSIKDVIQASHNLRDSGLKIGYHMMLGLPGSDFKRDLIGFKTILSDPRFMPDMLKIYPCLVIKGTEIYKWWKAGHYKPYSTSDCISLLTEIKKNIPEWVRIMRIQRDIPAYLIEDGVTKSNIREMAIKNLKGEGGKCRCIRCREIGLKKANNYFNYDSNNLGILIKTYQASGGIEYFISIENKSNDSLIGYLRLRFPSDQAKRIEVTEQTAIIRELRVCGPLVPVGKRTIKAFQHKGFGELLLEKAESISYQKGRDRILVTSALGTRQYYKRLGYNLNGPYMSKTIKN